MKNLTFTKLDLNRKYGLIDPDRGDRMGEMEMNMEILKKWVNTGDELTGGMNGNMCHHVNLNHKEGFVYLGKNNEYWNTDDRKERDVTFSEAISTSLLLYRLCCLFDAQPIIENNYKSIWDFPVKHKETGKVVCFGEHKGASNFWMHETDPDKLGESLKNDLIELIAFLLSDQIAHPYDGCTAGQIA
jgi:hypothetical protein